MTAPLSLYGAALRRAAVGPAPRLRLVGIDGSPVVDLHPAQWTGGLRPGDVGLLARCHGPTLDVGCGPGRLAAALTQLGHPVMGIDVSAEAVRQARRRGVVALCRSVFDRVPAEGRWRHVLLADGNLGIGGDPARLLRRCAHLVDPGGTVLVELLPPGERTWATHGVLHHGRQQSRAFPWAGVAVSDVAGLADAARLRILDLWTEAGRWFIGLARC
jgi:SAM-dependent methyltransferase